MKLSSLLLALLLSSSAASAATLIANASDTGLAQATGSSAVASGALRFGYFASGYDFAANANDIAALETAFIQVASYTGVISDSGFDGFFNTNLSYLQSGSFEGTPFDLSSGSTANVANDIAGEKIYLWVLNNPVATSATQHGIFSTNATWTDADVFPSNNSLFSIDNGTAGLTAHIGTLAAGPDLGGGNPSHRLANIAAVPEPSRAVLAFAGVAGVMFRRRRK